MSQVFRGGIGGGPGRLRWILTVLVCLLPSPQDGSAAETALPADAVIEAAVARGEDWMARYPATPEDGGLPDMLDEGVGFYVRRNLSTDPVARDRYSARLRAHMTRLGDLPEFDQWVFRGRKKLTDYYHLVLAAHLLQTAGAAHELQAQIAAQARQVLQRVQHCDPTKRLAIALFLQHLGEDPGIPLQTALAASRLERIARGRPPPLPGPSAPGQMRTAATLELYALVHEIVALTDFGRLSAPPWLEQRRAPAARFLGRAVAWAAEAGNFDLAAELLMSARLLGEPLTGPYREVVQALVAGQQADGSWGSHTTQRQNKQRHAVLTATSALWVYRYAPSAGQTGGGVL